MRVLFTMVFASLIGLTASTGMSDHAAAGPAHLSLSGLSSSAHVASPLTPVRYGEHADRCYVRHLECRYRSGFGSRYRRCMARADCGYRRHYGYGDVRRSCRYWLHRCRENWYYPEDIRGCLRYHGCAYY
ncbi:MAG: hypothetical protein ACLFPA_06100 [Dichotomicrobium sp.]